MKTFLRRLILVLIIAFIATILWDQKDRIGLLSNNSLRIMGEWHQVEMGFNTSDVYGFSERLITRNGAVWGSYELRMNRRLEVTISSGSTDYSFEFEDDDNMVWFIEVDGKRVPAIRWRR